MALTNDDHDQYHVVDLDEELTGPSRLAKAKVDVALAKMHVADLGDRRLKVIATLKNQSKQATGIFLVKFKIGDQLVGVRAVQNLDAGASTKVHWYGRLPLNQDQLKMTVVADGDFDLLDPNRSNNLFPFVYRPEFPAL